MNESSNSYYRKDDVKVTILKKNIILNFLTPLIENILLRYTNLKNIIPFRKALKKYYKMIILNLLVTPIAKIILGRKSIILNFLTNVLQ